MKRVIMCGQLFCAVDKSVQKDMAIVLEGNRIISVVPSKSIVCGDMEVIDLLDKFVMPGLIEGHSHMVCCGEADTNVWRMYKLIGEATIDSVQNLQADLLAGFTFVRDEAAIGFLDVDVRNKINSGTIWGPRLMVSGIALTPTGGAGDMRYRPGTGVVTYPESYMEMIIDGPVEAVKAARYNIKYGVDQIKLFVTGAIMSNEPIAGAMTMTYEEIKAAVDVAKLHGLLTSAHAHGAEGCKNAIRAGVSCIEHGMLMDDEAVDMLKEYNTFIIPTVIAGHALLEAGEAGGVPPIVIEKAKVCMERVSHNLHRMRKLSVNVGFGTDVGTTGNAHGTQAIEFELMMRYGGYTAAEVLLAATKINSHLIGWDDRIGSIEAGKLADIVAFSDNPLEDIKALRECSFVMKDGFIYKRDGRATFNKVL